MSRRDRLLYYIEKKGEATTNELQEIIGDCSKMTIWRDLKALEDQGCIRRVHGGAVLVKEQEKPLIGSYSDREEINPQGKRLIAEEAKTFVTAGKSLYFDAGTTIMAVVKALEPGVYTIITPSAVTALAMSKFTDSIVIGLGGQLNPTTLTFTGSYTEHFLEMISIDTAFISAPGFSEDGFSMSSVNEISIKQTAIRKANRVVMLMDSTKAGTVCPFSFAEWRDIDYLITDKPLPEKYMAVAKRYKVKVIVADKP